MCKYLSLLMLAALASAQAFERNLKMKSLKQKNPKKLKSTKRPTAVPSVKPSYTPTEPPTNLPTAAPTITPTDSPTSAPIP